MRLNVAESHDNLARLDHARGLRQVLNHHRERHDRQAE